MDEEFELIKRELYGMMRKMQQVKPLECMPADGVTCSEGQALHAIMIMADNEGADAVRPRAVSEHMCITPSALSQVVKALEGKGLVERVRNAQDSRSVILRLTEEGARRARVIDARWSEHMHELVERIGVDDFRHLIRTVNKILEERPPDPSELDRLVDIPSSQLAEQGKDRA